MYLAYEQEMYKDTDKFITAYDFIYIITKLKNKTHRRNESVSKKKKQKDREEKEKQDLLILVGNVLDEKYKTLTEEIFLMQEEVKREQRKEQKRAYKRMKKHIDL